MFKKIQIQYRKIERTRKTNMKNERYFSSPMLDGIKVGIKLPDLDQDTETKYHLDNMVEKLQEIGCSVTVGKTSTSFKLKYITFATLTLNHWRGETFLNIECNPVSFLYGHNQIGKMQIDKLLDKVFAKINAILLKKTGLGLPDAVNQHIADRMVYVHSISFAAYTLPLTATIPNVLAYLSHVYNFADASRTEPYTISSELNTKIYQDSKTSIRFERKTKHYVYWTFALYSKDKEVIDTGKTSVLETKNRLRLDLTLRAQWFAKNRLNTWNDISQKYGENYGEWAHRLFDRVLEDLKLAIVFAPSIDRSKISIKDQRTFHSWKKGKPLTRKQISDLQSIGIDASVSFRFYSTISFARLALCVPEELRGDFLLNPKKAVGNMHDWLVLNYGKNAQSLLDDYQPLVVDPDFPKFERVVFK